MNCRLATSLKIAVPGLALLLLGLTAVPAAQDKPGAKPAARAAAAVAEVKPGSYDIDPVHSNVLFRILHMNISPFWGRFNSVEGTFTLDPAKPEAATLDIKIAADSVDTNNGKRNQHVMSPDFLSVKEFQLIQFRSEKVKSSKPGVYEVAGKLTLHGVTKDVSMVVTETGAGEAMGGTVAGFESEFTIKRSDFGMDKMLDALSDEVKVVVGIEGRLH